MKGVQGKYWGLGLNGAPDICKPKHSSSHSNPNCTYEAESNTFDVFIESRIHAIILGIHRKATSYHSLAILYYDMLTGDANCP